MTLTFPVISAVVWGKAHNFPLIQSCRLKTRHHYRILWVKVMRLKEKTFHSWGKRHDTKPLVLLLLFVILIYSLNFLFIFGYFKILYQQFIPHVPTNYVYPVIISGYDYTRGNHKDYYPGVKGNFTFFFK